MKHNKQKLQEILDQMEEVIDEIKAYTESIDVEVERTEFYNSVRKPIDIAADNLYCIVDDLS